MTGLDVAAVVLASGEDKKSGPIGLAAILVLCVACYFLFKSMSKHLRKVREEFPTDEKRRADAAPTGEQRPGSSSPPPSLTEADTEGTDPPGTRRPGVSGGASGDGASGGVSGDGVSTERPPPTEPPV